MIYVILQKAKPYTRTRRGRFEQVRGYPGKPGWNKPRFKAWFNPFTGQSHLFPVTGEHNLELPDKSKERDWIRLYASNGEINLETKLLNQDMFERTRDFLKLYLPNAYKKKINWDIYPEYGKYGSRSYGKEFWTVEKFHEIPIDYGSRF